jgi:hypothetical protein
VKFQALRDLISAAGGRRFLMTVGAGIVNSFLVMHGDISMEIYRDLTLGTVAAYIVANTWQKRGNTDVRNDPEQDRP